MGYGYGQQMHGGGGGWLVMLVVLVLFAVVVIGAVWLIVGRPRRHADDRSYGQVAGPEQILAERLARGEIDPDEYRLRLAALREQAPRS